MRRIRFDDIESYVSSLRACLRRHGVVDQRFVQEVRDHLEDAVRAHTPGAASPLDALHAAIAQVGDPKRVVRGYLRERHGRVDRILILSATIVGLAIAFVDSRPHWDDAGLTAGAMLIAAAVCGLVAPRRAWLWALAIGVWIPAYALVETGGTRSLLMGIVLIFPMAGAYAGLAIRRVLTTA